MLTDYSGEVDDREAILGVIVAQSSRKHFIARRRVPGSIGQWQVVDSIGPKVHTIGEEDALTVGREIYYVLHGQHGDCVLIPPQEDLFGAGSDTPQDAGAEGSENNSRGNPSESPPEIVAPPLAKRNRTLPMPEVRQSARLQGRANRGCNVPGSANR